MLPPRTPKPGGDTVPTVRDSATGDARPNVEALRLRETLEQRKSPQFFTTDLSGTPISYSPGLEGSALFTRCIAVVALLLRRDGRPPSPSFERLDANVTLRIVALAGEEVNRYAIFIEGHQGRQSLRAAVRRFGISKREAEVLDLLVKGQPSPVIAATLYITPATVNDHVKSLLRKTETRNRAELVASIYQHVSDPLPKDV